ncbi:hypothetical protein B0T14DRAFT_43938 [Immersiella caudata]|uniref:Uncharacterized protein n=1 Tax=Immersiella caudata TaxID=314043 RepID=A0AA39XF47_9PEZI|nr:hypothetical protein B0T14DRAFT_43938 [Immersiella caudata]
MSQQGAATPTTWSTDRFRGKETTTSLIGDRDISLLGVLSRKITSATELGTLPLPKQLLSVRRSRVPTFARCQNHEVRFADAIFNKLGRNYEGHCGGRATRNSRGKLVDRPPSNHTVVNVTVSSPFRLHTLPRPEANIVQTDSISHPPKLPRPPKIQLQWNPELLPETPPTPNIAMVVSIKQRKVVGEFLGRWCRRGKELTV